MKAIIPIDGFVQNAVLKNLWEIRVDYFFDSTRLLIFNSMSSVRLLTGLLSWSTMCKVYSLFSSSVLLSRSLISSRRALILSKGEYSGSPITVILGFCKVDLSYNLKTWKSSYLTLFFRAPFAGAGKKVTGRSIQYGFPGFWQDITFGKFWFNGFGCIHCSGKWTENTDKT